LGDGEELRVRPLAESMAESLQKIGERLSDFELDYSSVLQRKPTISVLINKILQTIRKILKLLEKT
jgi:hypothetical protein